MLLNVPCPVVILKYYTVFFDAEQNLSYIYDSNWLSSEMKLENYSGCQ